MKTRKNYASPLTREELVKAGITLVTEDGLVFRGEHQVMPCINDGGYFVFQIYELDENGNKVKKPIKRQYKGCKKVTDTYTYQARTVGLHRLMWAWFHNEVPAGYIVDHIDNKHETQEDYRLSNLQLLTPGENLAKERGESTKQLKCKLNKPLSFYEDKLNNYLTEYEAAKANHDADTAHRLRANIANMKAKIRYWKAHQDEVEQIQAEKDAEQAKKDAYHAKAARLRELEEITIAARMEYLQAQYDYGKDSFMTQCAKQEWRNAVRERNEFLGIKGKNDGF